jgi:sensor histidine kinase regulating citrate/malate metabolism
VVESVLKNGMTYSTMTDRLGRVYYSAYKPIRHIDGRIIGMVSVGTVANELFEDTRQQLLTIFLLVTVMALLAAMVAYRAVFLLQEGKKKEKQKEKK